MSLTVLRQILNNLPLGEHNRTAIVLRTNLLKDLDKKSALSAFKMVAESDKIIPLELMVRLLRCFPAEQKTTFVEWWCKKRLSGDIFVLDPYVFGTSTQAVCLHQKANGNSLAHSISDCCNLLQNSGVAFSPKVTQIISKTLNNYCIDRASVDCYTQLENIAPGLIDQAVNKHLKKLENAFGEFSKPPNFRLLRPSFLHLEYVSDFLSQDTLSRLNPVLNQEQVRSWALQSVPQLVAASERLTLSQCLEETPAVRTRRKI